MNTMHKNNVPRMAPAAKVKSPRSRVIGRLLGVALQVPPAAYIVLTGTVPLWARIWLCVWLSLWLLLTVVTAVRAQTAEAGR